MSDPCADLRAQLAEALRDNDALTDMLVKYVELYNAAIYSADRSGLGSDRVWEIARKIKAMQGENNAGDH